MFMCPDKLLASKNQCLPPPPNRPPYLHPVRARRFIPPPPLHRPLYRQPQPGGRGIHAELLGHGQPGPGIQTGGGFVMVLRSVGLYAITLYNFTYI